MNGTVPDEDIKEMMAQARILMHSVTAAISRPFLVNVTHINGGSRRHIKNTAARPSGSSSSSSASKDVSTAAYRKLPPTVVVFVLAGRAYTAPIIDDCIARVNSHVAYLARQFGFHVSGETRI